ncbi:MAG: 3-oxoacyl-[acyl-carrier-protein] synthase III C-terminal domain-containing protein [Enhygromyxa sp.]
MHRDPPSAPVIAGTGTGVPPHLHSQRQLVAFARELIGGDGSKAALERMFAAVGVEQRHLALPAEAYAELGGFGSRNEAWLEVARSLAEQVVRDTLREAELEPSAVALLVTTTVTGVAVPSLDARLMNAIDFAPTLKRVPLFGLGCVGGAAGIARVADYLRAFPEQTAMLLSVELCSLTFQRDDASIANLISTGLFGDGAAAVLLAGAAHPLARRARPAVLDSRSVFFPNTERLMGWDMVDSGFRVVLGPGVPDLVERELPPAIDAFLAAHGLSREDIGAWIAHPGGPKVIRAVQQALELADEQVEATRESLASFGNLSSASVLFVLDDYRRRRAPPPGSYGLLFALGPAFCAELVLLRW